MSVNYVFPPDELKRRLPIGYVARALGLEVKDDRAICPMHDDHRPSLELKEGGAEGDWWVCSPCGTGGDVIRLVREVQHCSFGVALRRLTEMLEELPADRTWDGDDIGPRFVPDETWEKRLLECATRSVEHAHAGLTAYSYGLLTGDEPDDVKAAWDTYLIDQWEWCIDETARVLIPHRAPDGTLTGVKARRRGDPRRVAWGAFDHLYGSWREQGHEDVVLCEGESDCVWAAASGEAVDALALPAGARGARSDWKDWLARYQAVYLAFDADAAGERAQRSWKAALGNRAVPIRLSEGEDLRSCGTPLGDLLRRANRE